MWRSSCTVLKNTLSSSLRRPPPPALGFRRISAVLLSSADVDTTTTTNNNNNNNNSEKINTEISICEAKKLMRLVNVEALKNRLGTEGKEVIAYKDLLESCEAMGVAKSKDEADRFVKVLDEAGVVLVFGERVYLHPDKIVELVKKAVPLVLTPEDNPMREELETLLAKKEQLDILAHKQVRFILWTGLGFGILQVGLFFRLTFWEFSWDVMEPIAFFTTATGIVIGYAYFLYTSRDPTYRDFMQRVFLSRQRKLMKKHNFDFDRFLALQKKCKFPFEGHDVSRQQTGMGLGRDTFH